MRALVNSQFKLVEKGTNDEGPLDCVIKTVAMETNSHRFSPDPSHVKALEFKDQLKQIQYLFLLRSYSKTKKVKQ